MSMSFPPYSLKPSRGRTAGGLLSPLLKSVYLGGKGSTQGRQVYRKSLVAAFCERLCNWYSTVRDIFQLLAGKHQVVVNHSTAAVQTISAWELGRDVGTCSRPQEPCRTISQAIYAEMQGSWSLSSQTNRSQSNTCSPGCGGR